MSIPMGGGTYQTAPQVDLGWIGRGWDLFKANAGTWVGAFFLYLVVAAAIAVPLAFLTGYSHNFTDAFNAARAGVPAPQPASPLAGFGGNMAFSLLFGAVNSILLGGLYRMGLRQAQGEAVSITDVFSALDMAGPLVVVNILTQLLVGVGSLLCVIPGLIVAGLLMFAPLLVLDRRLPPVQAMSESFALLKSQWLMAAVFYLVAALLDAVGAIVLGIGMLITYPVFLLSVVVGYLTFTQTEQPLPGYGQPQEGVWPPPPSTGQTPPGSVWPPPPSA